MVEYGVFIRRGRNLEAVDDLSGLSKKDAVREAADMSFYEGRTIIVALLDDDGMHIKEILCKYTNGKLVKQRQTHPALHRRPRKVRHRRIHKQR